MIHTIEGEQWEKVTHPTAKRFTGPSWLFGLYNNYQSSNGKARLVPEDRTNIKDDAGNTIFTQSDGLLIIPTEIENDPTWNLDIIIPHPDGGTTTPRQEMTKIPYVYLKEI